MRFLTLKNGLIAFVLAGLGVVIAPFLEPIDSDPKAARLAQTKSILLLVNCSIDYWSRERKRVPTTAEGLDVLDLRSKPLLDGWGRPLVYKYIDNALPSQYLLYSIGKNGVDESGGGDDVRIQNAKKLCN